jgi:putative endonuclease
MTNQDEVGRYGEQLATDFLEDKGFIILERNWRFSRAEIDIIAMDGSILVFIEVKTRSGTFFGLPEDFVSKKKEILISDAAAAYMRSINHEWEFRFDIIGIVLPKNRQVPQINHTTDAFFPGI